MGGYVSEIFGFPPTNKSKKAEYFRNGYYCPFQGKKVDCDPVNKKSNLSDENGNLLLSHQTGACSVFHKYATSKSILPIIICPYRFLEIDEDGNIKVFKYISDKFFAGKDLIFIPEVGIGSYGRADWIICEFKSENFNKITNFEHGEFQSDATTNTRELVLCVRDFFLGKDINNRQYNYGLNSKASIKSSSLQMIDKGFLFQKLGKKSYWVMQDTLFDILSSIFNVEMEDITTKGCPEDHTLIFITTKLLRHGKKDILNSNPQEEDKFTLEISKTFSISVDELQRGISEKEIISEDFIIKATQNKIKGGKFMKINVSK